jgi:hypothetical protein
MRCPACEAVNQPQARDCEECGQKLPRRRVAEGEEDEADENTRLSPFALSAATFKNVKALYAFYCGVFGLIPVAGLLLGPAGVVLGVGGLRYLRANPKAKGKGLAMTGVVLGGLELVFNAAGVALILKGLQSL